jgi:hypothetical protein
MVETLLQQMGDAPKPIWGRVLYHLLCSENDAAADWYEKSIQAGDGFALIYAKAPYGRSLRQSAHLPKLVQMLNLPDQRLT